VATAKIPQTNERAHELRKAEALLSYARWCDEHGEPDAEIVRTTAQRVLQRAERA